MVLLSMENPGTKLPLSSMKKAQNASHWTFSSRQGD